MTTLLLRALVWLNRRGKSAARHLARLSGKSRVPLHPKHLLGEDAGGGWYREHVPPGQTVLDLGCGSGSHARRLAALGAHVVACDRDAGALALAKLLASEHPAGSVALVQANAERPLPFATGAFEQVLLLDVLEHVEARRTLLRELHRLLTPDGRLLLSAPNRETSWKRRLRAAGLDSRADPDHKVEYTWEELEAELAAGGFRVQGTPQPIVYDTPWAGLMDALGGLWLGAYRRLMRWKVRMAERHPEETTGWRVVCRRAG